MTTNKEKAIIQNIVRRKLAILAVIRKEIEKAAG